MQLLFLGKTVKAIALLQNGIEQLDILISCTYPISRLAINSDVET
ncbi:MULTISPECIES: hypothetical protein [Fischerella]|nr:MULTISPECIES: hypothetical protein [Fischerella]